MSILFLFRCRMEQESTLVALGVPFIKPSGSSVVRGVVHETGSNCFLNFAHYFLERIFFFCVWDEHYMQFMYTTDGSFSIPCINVPRIS